MPSMRLPFKDFTKGYYNRRICLKCKNNLKDWLVSIIKLLKKYSTKKKARETKSSETC